MQTSDLDKIHGIGTVTRRTGLTSHAIRAWERRYNAVSPERSEGNQRLYSDTDILRLLLLKRATTEGMNISRAVSLDDDALRAFIKDERILPQPSNADEVQPIGSIDDLVNAAIGHIYDLQQSELYELLQQATIEHGLATVLNQFVGAFTTAIGDSWRSGEMRIYHEHLASVVIRSFLGKIIDNQRRSDELPTLIATTPAGQLHEIGAMLCAAVATTEHLRAIYLGPNTPAEEIIKVVRETKAQYLALSLYYPLQDQRIVDELRLIDSGVAAATEIILGGPASVWYYKELGNPRIKCVTSMLEFRDVFLRA